MYMKKNDLSSYIIHVVSCNEIFNFFPLQIIVVVVYIIHLFFFRGVGRYGINSIRKQYKTPFQ